MKSYSRWITLIVFAMCFTFGFARAEDQPPQQQNKQQEVIVRIQQEQTKAPDSDKSVVKKADEWVEFGTHLGQAFDAGLSSLSDHADKFSKTDAGKFTMFVIAWKVVGRDAIELTKSIKGVVVGVPIQIVILCIYVWVIRRFFMSRVVVINKTGGMFTKDRVVTYGLINATNEKYTEKNGTLAGVKVLSYLDNEERFIGLTVSSIIFIIISMMNLGWVIF